MSKWLKALLIFVAVLMFLITVCAVSSAENETPNTDTDEELKIKVHLFDATEAYAEIQKLPGDGEEYALFLPSDCDRDNLRLTFDYKELFIGSKSINNGETTSAFAKDKTVKIKTDEGNFNVKVCSSENLPAVFITTESGSLSAIHADKSYKEKATLTLADGGKTALESSALTHIKGRGNSTWRYNEKRSYNIKFAEKTEILGMAAAKKWALVSNSMDPTLMRNAIAYTAAKLTNLPYTVDFRFVDLYINGNYRGNYIICEKIEIDKNRININDLEKANESANPGIDLDDAECVDETVDEIRLKWWKLPNDPSDISGGYLLEYDYKEIIETGQNAFKTRYGFCLNIHSPEHITQKEIKYVSSLYDEFEQALYSPDGKNSKGKSFMDYIDVESFVEAAIVYEFAKDQDYGRLSRYIFLPNGVDRFFAGPIWDFDMSMKSPDLIPDSVYFVAEKLNERPEDESSEESKDPWEGSTLRRMFSMRKFAELVAKRTLEFCNAFESQLNDKTNEMFDLIAASAKCDRLRWDYQITEKKDIQMRTYVTERIKTLKKYFFDFDASVETEAKNILEGKAEYEIPENEKGLHLSGVQIIVIATSSAVTAAIVIVCVSAVKKKKRGEK